MQSKECLHTSILAGARCNQPARPADHDPEGTIRKSRNGKRRAIVLITRSVAAHRAHRAVGAQPQVRLVRGRTTTPIEPSESMEFVKNGLVNAGLIFFSIALLSTLILGRWFCGWGCHIVMLQDLCGWMMKKMGVRPKPFRSRFLDLRAAAFWRCTCSSGRRRIAGAIPLDNRWPQMVTLARTWLRQARFPLSACVQRSSPPHEFWKTFPGVMVAIPFLLVCGFATVYFLGAKGFCTYGCPYGGFFAPLDKFAVGKIRVTDACEGCGHCTAVCTSNVRVHEEVREYGMVVDPGCMKCLDCVSVCPNDALVLRIRQAVGAQRRCEESDSKSPVRHDAW